MAAGPGQRRWSRWWCLLWGVVPGWSLLVANAVPGYIHGKAERKNPWVIFQEEPLNEVFCAMEGLGLLGWVRFGFLVVWWLLLPCPHGLKKSVLSSGILGFFRDLVKGNEFHRHPQRLLQRG